MEFMIGYIAGGILCSAVVYFRLKGKYEQEITDAYVRGWNDEKRTIIDYIEFLERRSKVEGSEEQCSE